MRSVLAILLLGLGLGACASDNPAMHATYANGLPMSTWQARDNQLMRITCPDSTYAAADAQHLGLQALIAVEDQVVPVVLDPDTERQLVLRFCLHRKYVSYVPWEKPQYTYVSVRHTHPSARDDRAPSPTTYGSFDGGSSRGFAGEPSPPYQAPPRATISSSSSGSIR